MPQDPPALTIHLFGTWEARSNGQPLPRLRSRTGQALLALLILRNGRSVERTWLAATLWPDSGEEQALYNLRRNLTDLRHTLGPHAERLTAPTPRTLRLDLKPDECDLLAFDAAVATKDPATLEQAVALYRGPLLQDFTDDWLMAERDIRQQANLVSLESLACRAAEQDDHARAARHWRQVIAADSLRESAVCALMQALAQNGEWAAMTQAYRNFRLNLRHELNAEPDAATQSLYEKLKQAAREAATQTRQRAETGPEIEIADTLAPPVSKPFLREAATPTGNLPYPLTRLIGRAEAVRDVGRSLRESRLLTLTGPGGVGKTRLALAVAEASREAFRDGVWFTDLSPLASPLQVVQAVANVLGVAEEADFPLLETLVCALRGRSLLLVLDNCEHLPEASGELAAALLTGSAGLHVLATSRQPLHVAGERVWRVPSLPTASEADIAGREAADVTEANGFPAVSPDEAAVVLFAERASQADANFVLTADNAASTREICRRVDGIPLAIELAAAQIGGLSVNQIAARLDDAFRLLARDGAALPRHRTLRGAMDWSYRLLSPVEQSLLARCTVFAGGWSLDAAEAVCGNEMEARTEEETKAEAELPTEKHRAAGQQESTQAGKDVPFLLARLVERSLVVFDTASERYRLLETVRQYAVAKLPVGEWAALREGHLLWYTEWLGRHKPALSRETPPFTLLALLDADNANFRIALDWAQTAQEPTAPESKGANQDVHSEQGLRLAVRLFPYWKARGMHSEGRAYLERGLTAPGLPLALRVAALSAAGRLAARQGENAVAIAQLREALALCQSEDIPNPAHAPADTYRQACVMGWLGHALSSAGEFAHAQVLLEHALRVHSEQDNTPERCLVLDALAYIAREQGHTAHARALLEEALSLCAKAELPEREASCRSNLGHIYYEQGDLAGAAGFFETARVLYQQVQNRSGEAFSLCSLGDVLKSQGHYLQARDRVDKALTLNRATGNRSGEAWNLKVLGDIALQLGRSEQALGWFQQALDRERELHNHNNLAWALFGIARATRAQGDFAASNQWHREAFAMMQTPGIKRGMLRVADSLAATLHQQGDHREAVRLWAAVSAAKADMETATTTVETERSRHWETMQVVLDAEPFNRAWDAGQVLTLEQAMSGFLTPLPPLPLWGKGVTIPLTQTVACCKRRT